MATYNNIPFYVHDASRARRVTAGAGTFGGWSSSGGTSAYLYSAVSFRLKYKGVGSESEMIPNYIESATIDIDIDNVGGEDSYVSVYIGNIDLSGKTDRQVGSYAKLVDSFSVSGNAQTTKRVRTPSSFDRLSISDYLYVTLVIDGTVVVACTDDAVAASVTPSSIYMGSITPKSIQTEINKSQEITIRASGLGPFYEEYLYADGTVTLTANKKTIASCKLSDGSPRTVDYDDFSTREDIFKFTCTTDWFKTIESTQDTITVTVTIEDESVFKRKATGTFEIIKPPLSLTAKESEVTMISGSSYTNNKIYVEGSAGGVYSVTVKHGTVTENPYTEYSTAEFYAKVYKSWFQNQNFDNTNVTVTIQDELYRTAQVSFKASLPQMTVSTDKDSYESVSSGKQVSVSVDGAVGSTKISYRIGSSTTEDVGGSFGLLDDLFANTRSNQLSVTIIAQSREYKQSAQTTITLTAGDAVYPKVSQMKVENVPHIKMPSDYANDYVAGYSKVKVSIKYTSGAAYIGDFTDFKLSGLGETVDLTYNGNPDDAWFTAITDSVIQRQTTLTATITDSMGRKGTAQITIAENDIVKLPPITVTPQSTSVEAGKNAVFEVAGFVGSYDISFWNLSKQLTGGDTKQTAQTYTQKAKTDWFTEASVTGNSISVTVTVTDVLGRSPSQTVRITVTLPKLTLTLRHQDEIIKKLVINHILQVDFEGTGGEEVILQLTTGSGENLINYGTWHCYDHADINCPKEWFTWYTELDNTATIQITVNATTNTQSAIATFDLVYPDLGLTLQKSDGSGDTATDAKVGDNVIYAFANQEGEDVNVHYYCSNFSTPIRSLGPYSASSVTIATPQLFDDANANTVQTMKVSVVISDKRGRTARVDNFTVNASVRMSPRITNLTITPVNEGAEETFQNAFIENFSKFIAVLTIELNSAAIVPASNVILTVQSKNYTMVSIGNNQFRYASNEPIGSGNLVYSATAKDERGLSAEIGGRKQTLTYAVPRASINYHRCNQDKSPNDSGDYCLLTCDYVFGGIWTATVPTMALNKGEVTISTVGYNNTVELNFYRSPALPPGAEPPQEDVPDHGTLEFLIPNMSIEQTYKINITLTDLITSTSYTVTLSTGYAIMDIYHGGKGVAFGKVAEGENLLEVSPTWELKASVKINGQLYDLATLLSQIKQQLGL